jgi:aminobenzoyl-glutamate utilization protein B
MDISAWIESQRMSFTDLSDRVWEYAELGFTEERSSELLASTLEQAGFELRRGLAGMPTAFVASYGTGRPVIAILGEFDALPGLSQAVLPEEKPVHPDGNGHGCGHNLLGVAGLAAALGVQQALQAGGITGTVRYYGCPAEENGAGKVFLVKAGLFKDVDLSLCWHPDYFNGVMTANDLAVVLAVFRFHGRASHAAYDPYNGRSALDAVELMNVGANYLREHVIPDGRLHYVITNGGGPAPNVVPPLAESKYLVRAPLMSQAEEIYQRLQDVGRGAALMTGTEMEIVLKKGMSNLVLIPEINQVLYEKMVAIGAPQFSPREQEFARQISKTFTTEEAESLVVKMYGPQGRTLLEQAEDRTLFTPILPNVAMDYVVPGSTDVGDVSWVTPTGQVETACSAFGTPSHSWQTVAQAGMGIGHTGMLYAGKIIALAAWEFMTKPERLQKARQEFKEKIKKTPYVCPIPDGVKPF